MSTSGTRYRLSAGWLAYLGPQGMRVISPCARSWAVEPEPGSSNRLVQILDGRLACEGSAEIELLRRLEELGAVTRIVPEGSPADDTYDIFVPRETSPSLLGVIEAAGLQPKRIEDAVVGEPVLMLVENLLSDFLLEVNRRVLAENLRVLVVIAQGSAVSVGPLIDPRSGGPCLRCLQERTTASLLAACRWAGDQDSAVVRLGSAPASKEAIHVAMILARRTVSLIRTEKSSPTGHALCEMKRVFLDEGRAEILTCYPLPWCPDCSPGIDEERPMVDYRDVEDVD